MTVKMTYKGETLAQGMRASSSLMFWNAIDVEDSVDMPALLARLADIRRTDGVHYETYGRRINVAPAYKVVDDSSDEYALWPERVQHAEYTEQTMPAGWVWCEPCAHAYPPASVHARAVVQERSSS